MKPNSSQIKKMKKRYGSNCKVTGYKCTLVKVCPYCGKMFEATHTQQKYCTRECFANARREYKARWKREKYQPKMSLGTGYINGKRNKDFEREHEILQKELKRVYKR